MRTFKLLVAYDGTDYVGWQRQPSGDSIQGLIETALAPIEGGPVTVVGAGRTDAGVHATGQVASVCLTSGVDAADLRRALNARLPPDVRVLAADVVADTFHARFHARAKTYEYRIVNAVSHSPFAHRYTWHIPWRLEIERMADAALLIEGVHDFAAFQSAGSSVTSTRRRVFSSALIRAGNECVAQSPETVVDGELLVYRVTGDGFLRHMVRAIVGALVEIGSRRAETTRLSDLLDRTAPRSAAPTAPAHGLCLRSVAYTEPFPEVVTHR
jgi:tRNA pseudouridine38-40 synthase